MNNSPTDWAKLTERYYAGETSLEEEAALRRHWQETAPQSGEAELVAYFETAAREGLSKEIELPAAAFSTTEEGLSLPQVKPPTKQPARLRVLRPLLAIAASIALILLSFWYWPADTDAILAMEEGNAFPTAEETDWSKYEVTDPDEALAILTGSLRQVAEPFRTGAMATRPLGNLSKLNNPLPQ